MCNQELSPLLVSEQQKWLLKKTQLNALVYSTTWYISRPPFIKQFLSHPSGKRK
jgi:hypothetical protein